MNYQKVYDALIQKRINQKLTNSDLGEIHHIKPKSIFPEFEYDPNNLIKLTYREHYIAHLLLMHEYYKQYGKCSNEYRKMLYTLKSMMGKYKKYGKYSSQQFEKVKNEVYRLGGPNKNRKFSDEWKTNISKAHKGCIPWNAGLNGQRTYVNDGHKSKTILKSELQSYLDQGWSKGRLNFNWSPTIEQRQKLSIKMRGRKLSDSTKEKMRGKHAWNKGKHYKQHNPRKNKQSIEDKIQIQNIKNEYIHKLKQLTGSKNIKIQAMIEQIEAEFEIDALNLLKTYQLRLAKYCTIRPILLPKTK